MQTHKKTLTLFFTVLLVLATLAILPALASPITVATEKDEYKAGDSLTVSGTATPNALVSIQLFDPNGKRKAIAQATSNIKGVWLATNIYTFSTTDKDGTWTIKAYEKGWVETTIKVDITPPTLTISVEPNKTVYKEETMEITVVSNENLSSVTITITQAGASPETAEITKVNNTTWIGTYNIKPDFEGPTTMKIQARDIAGNLVETTKIFSVDTTPPKVMITEIPAKTEEATITIKGTVSEPVPEVELLIPGLTPIKVPVNSKTLTWETEVLLLTTGHNVIKAIATDKAGNIGEDSRVVFYVGPLETIKTELATIKESLTLIETLIIIAVVLSIVAAVFSTFAVITIVRRIVVK